MVRQKLPFVCLCVKVYVNDDQVQRADGVNFMHHIAWRCLPVITQNIFSLHTYIFLTLPRCSVPICTFTLCVTVDCTKHAASFTCTDNSFSLQKFEKIDKNKRSFSIDLSIKAGAICFFKPLPLEPCLI